MNLWLDDQRSGERGFVRAKTYEQAIHLLEIGGVDFASLDHDLSIEAAAGRPSPDEKTGYDVVLWMEEHGVWPMCGVRVHSMNPVGTARMVEVIERHYKKEFMDHRGCIDPYPVHGEVVLL